MDKRRLLQLRGRSGIFAMLGVMLVCAACSSSPQGRFEKMTNTELMAYNRTVEFMDQVYCVDEIRTGSHLRRRHCETLIEIQERLAKSASAISIIGTAQIF